MNTWKEKNYQSYSCHLRSPFLECKSSVKINSDQSALFADVTSPVRKCKVGDNYWNISFILPVMVKALRDIYE